LTHLIKIINDSCYTPETETAALDAAGADYTTSRYRLQARNQFCKGENKVRFLDLEQFFDELGGISDGFYGECGFFIHFDIEFLLEGGDEFD
jgi:hypothetical protein